MLVFPKKKALSVTAIHHGLIGVVGIGAGSDMGLDFHW